MDKSISGIRPESLTPQELVKYAYLELDEKGLNKAWAEALIKALEAKLYKKLP